MIEKSVLVAQAENYRQVGILQEGLPKPAIHCLSHFSVICELKTTLPITVEMYAPFCILYF